MIEYVLILTLVTLTSAGDGIANSIESIPGFASQGDCERAGAAWLSAVRKLSRTAESSYSCVRQQKSGRGTPAPASHRGVSFEGIRSRPLALCPGPSASSSSAHAFCGARSSAGVAMVRYVSSWSSAAARAATINGWAGASEQVGSAWVASAVKAYA